MRILLLEQLLFMEQDLLSACIEELLRNGMPKEQIDALIADITKLGTEFSGTKCGSVSIKDHKAIGDESKFNRYSDEMSECVTSLDQRYQYAFDLATPLSADEFFALANAFWMHFRHSAYSKRRYGEPPFEDPKLNEYEAAYLGFEPVAQRFCDLDIPPENFGLGLELQFYHTRSNRVLVVHRDYQDDVYKFMRFTRYVAPSIREALPVKLLQQEIFVFVAGHPSVIPSPINLARLSSLTDNVLPTEESLP